MFLVEQQPENRKMKFIKLKSNERESYVVIGKQVPVQLQADSSSVNPH